MTVKELIAAAADRLMDALEAGKSEQLREYLAVMGRFHRYSVNNQLAIFTQRSDATHVAGYRTWQSLGRQVKKGERGIRILAPIMLHRRVPLVGETAEEEDEPIAFKPAVIFDISQTEGKALPEPAQVHGEPAEYLDRLKRHLQASGMTLEFSDHTGTALGWCCGNRIVVRTGLSPAEEFAVLVHELAHAQLHRAGVERGNTQTREGEAEAVACVVCFAIGLDVVTSSSDYLLSYRVDRKMLMASLERIHGVASQVIGAIMHQEIQSGPSPSAEASTYAAAA